LKILGRAAVAPSLGVALLAAAFAGLALPAAVLTALGF
jgi:hypothetical protein